MSESQPEAGPLVDKLEESLERAADEYMTYLSTLRPPDDEAISGPDMLRRAIEAPARRDAERET